MNLLLELIIKIRKLATAELDALGPDFRLRKQFWLILARK